MEESFTERLGAKRSVQLCVLCGDPLFYFFSKNFAEVRHSLNAELFSHLTLEAVLPRDMASIRFIIFSMKSDLSCARIAVSYEISNVSPVPTF